jgi:opacity protein-like surface antigen
LVLGLLATSGVRPVAAEPYFSIYTGAAIPSGWAVSDRSPFNATIDDWEFDASTTVGGKLGYWLDPFPALGIESEIYARFHDFGPENVKIDGQDTTVRADTESVDFGFNLLLRLPSGPLRPYGGAGLGIHVVEISNIGLSAPRLGLRTSDSLGEDTDVAPGLHIIGGLQWEVVEGVSLGVEYKYLKHDLEFDDPEVALDIEVDDHLVTGGITFYFRKPFDEILRDLLP